MAKHIWNNTLYTLLVTFSQNYAKIEDVDS